MWMAYLGQTSSLPKFHGVSCGLLAANAPGPAQAGNGASETGRYSQWKGKNKNELQWLLGTVAVTIPFHLFVWFFLSLDNAAPA